MNREAVRKRLVKLIEEAHKKSAEAIHEHITATLKEKGRFNSKTDADRRSIYEIEADYLLDNGIIVPPCKVGTEVYVLGDEYFWEAEIIGWLYFVDKHTVLQNTLYYMHKGEERIHYFEVDDIGKTVFFSKAEAEYALKNRRSVSLVDGHIEE